MTENNKKSDYWHDLEALENRVKALERAVSLVLAITSASSAATNSIYIDEADGKAYFKDAAGTSNALY